MTHRKESCYTCECEDMIVKEQFMNDGQYTYQENCANCGNLLFAIIK